MLHVRTGGMDGRDRRRIQQARIAEADAQAEFLRPSTERVCFNHDLARPPDSQSLMPGRLEQALHLPVPDEVLMRLVFRFCTCWSILFCYAKA